MDIETLRFGKITIDDSDIILFPHGIPGFESLTQYVLLNLDEGIPFSVLQAVVDGTVSFILTNPFLFFPQYEFELSDPEQKELKVQNENDISVWSIVSVQDDIREATLNLQAPVILNQKENIGKQIILHNSTYKTKHKLLNESEKLS